VTKKVHRCFAAGCRLFCAGVALVALSADAVVAEGELTSRPSIQVSGFFDVLSSYQGAQMKNGEFGFGQAEIDLATALSPNISMTLAVAYNNAAKDFGLGAAFMDWRVWKKPESAAAGGLAVDNVGVIVGRFDVPFGIDYRVYPSPVRQLVNCPTSIELTHCRWNDAGVQLYGNSPVGNVALFAVNGFASSATHWELQLNLATGEEEMVEVSEDTTPKMATGGRLGLTIVPGAEIGGSYAVGVNHDNHVETELYGLDMQYTRGPARIKGEALWHAVNQSIAPALNHGYYLEGAYSFGKPFIVLRRDGYSPEDQDSRGSWSPGIGYRLIDQAQFRAQYQMSDQRGVDAVWFQTVVSF